MIFTFWPDAWANPAPRYPTFYAMFHLGYKIFIFFKAMIENMMKISVDISERIGRLRLIFREYKLFLARKTVEF